MKIRDILSVQLYDCPEDISRLLDCTSETTTQPVAKKNPPVTTSSERLHHQAVQTMRKARLQMRQGAGTWTEALSIGQLPRRAAQTGIHSAGISGTGRILSGRLSFTAGDNRGNLQYQFGAIASTRKLVRRDLAQRALIHCPTCRRGSGRHIGRQHARNVAHPRARRVCTYGGER